MNNNSKLYLIPSNIGETDLGNLFPQFNFEIINSIDYYIVEEERTARRFLRKMGIKKRIDELTFFELNEHSKNINLNPYLQPCLDGNNVGLLSEAGTPCVADPGNLIVTKVHQFGIEVVPLIGPNSILLALMASGFNGQNFAFNGYLPVERPQRESQINFFENLMIKTAQTQIFIETPYRNNHLLDSFLKVCNPETRLCIACNLTTDNQKVISQSISKWKKGTYDFHKMPAIFLIVR